MEINDLSEVEVGVDGVRLAGTLVRLPAVRNGQQEPRPAALLLSGSGPLDRDSNMPGQAIDISKALAAALAARGIASMRYDKRGVGKSGGDFRRTGLYDEALDAAAVLGFLRSQHGIDPDQVVVIGHSVGAVIGARLARLADPPPAGYVLLAAPAQRGELVMAWQTHQIAATTAWPWRLAGPWLERMAAKERARVAAAAPPGRPESRRAAQSPIPERWLREYMAHDPAADLAAIDRPVLAITGTHDIQVSHRDLQLIGDIVHGPVEADSPHALTHLLRRDPRRGLRYYRDQCRRPVDPQVLDRITDWVMSITR